MRPEFIPVGAVVNAHGIRGEVKVNPAGFDPEFIASFKTLYIGGQATKVAAARVHKSTVLLSLPGVATMDDALALKGKTVSIRRTDAKLPAGQYFDAELEGCLHIGTLESLCFFRLPGLMHQFRVEHPKVSLRVTTGSPEELIEKMERGEVDLICILDEPRYSNSWHKCNEVPEEVVFVASPDIDLGHPGPYRVAELLDKPFFLTERNANYRRTFDRFLASRQIELTPSLEISDTSFIIKMLERSSGISLLPRFAVAEPASRGDLRILEVSDFRLTMYRQMFYHKDKCCTREMDAFIQLASGPDLPLL